MDEIRDPEIARLLSGGSVAEHEPGYWDSLREAVAPELEALEPKAMSGPRPRRRRLLRMALAAAAVAAAAVVAFAVLPALHGTDAATAADMLASMNAASSDVQTVRLHIVQGPCGSPDASPPPASPQPTTIAGQVALIKRKTIADLILSTSGDFRASQGTERLVAVEKPLHMGQYGYDASRHELRIDRQWFSVWLPAWPTGYPNTDVAYLNYQTVANSVRAILAEADPEMPVTETIYLGRPAWTTDLRTDLGSEWPDYERRVTVDQATGLLLASDQILQRPRGDELVTSLRVTRLEVDPDLPKDWQLVPFPKKTRGVTPWVSYMDEGVRFGSPKSVAERSGSTPALFPRWVPQGYRRSAAATAVFDDPRPGHEYDNSWHWGSERIEPHGSTPGMSFGKRLALKRCKQKVLVEYRRGFDTFTITVNRRLPGEGLIDQRRGDDPKGRDVILTGGYLKGATARTWLSAADYGYRGWNGYVWADDTQGPTLQAYEGRWKILISGGLTRQELIDVANSLEQIQGH